MKYLFLILCSVITLHAGQSLIITGPRALFVEANSGNSAPWRVEFQLHNWTVSGSLPIAVTGNGTGFDASWTSSTQLEIDDKRDTLTGGVIPLPATTTIVKVRIQRNPTGSAISGFPASTFAAEIWNNDGTGYAFGTDTITALNTWIFSGGAFADAGGMVAEDVGFYRVMNTLVPLHSLSPVTANPNCPSANCLTEYKLDGNLTDSGGICTSSCIVPGSGPTYINTPGQTAFSYLATAFLPSSLAQITSSIPLRAPEPPGNWTEPVASR